MNAFRRLIHSRWFKSALGVIALSVLIWWFGPALGIGQMHPFDSTIVRIITIVVLVVLWLTLNLLRELHDAKKERDLVTDVSAPDAAAAADAAAVAAETSLLSERMRTALADLKKAKLGGGKRLYQLPWYMFIGPPGAGKTTALVNSGLRFPLADKAGPQAISGVGGTRNCDWWFTDEAVLIDTAGRYTTQDSQASVDAAAWTGFLRLLKKHRRRQPLNGILLAISLTDLSELDDAARAAHAQTMRKRIRELHEELGVRLPIYVLFTKADLIAGFVEFFDTLGREEREQVWGVTFPLDDGKSEGGAVQGFAAGFDGLMARLNDRLLERVNQETDIRRRRLIYGFPQQVASLRGVAAEFMTEIFKPSRLEARPLLRGVYLTSGTQDGTPIDRLLGSMAGQFGLPRQAVTAFSGAGRSYFLQRLMRDVVFPEAGLVSTDVKLERRARITQWAAFGSAVAVLALLVAMWTLSYFSNLDMIAQVHDETGRYNGDLKALAERGPQDIDLPAALPPLNELRTLRGGHEDREKSIPIALTFGLYQGNKLSTAATDAYYHGLNTILLPRLLARLEGELNSHLGKTDALYELLKVYLILGRQGPIDAGLIAQWLNADLSASYSGDEDAPVRDALMNHAAAMLERPLMAIPLDGPLIARVREVLTREPLAEYSYGRILRSRRMRELPEWTVADNAGPGASRVFMLRSGHKLDSGVPGAFTYSGYHNSLLTLLPTVTQDIAEDGWVLGKSTRGGVAATLAETTRLRRDVLGLYLDDYVRHWDVLLGDIAVKPFTSIEQGQDELNLLAAPDSPLRDLFQALDTQTLLSRSGAGDKATAQAEGKLAKMASKAAGFAKIEGMSGMSREENELASVLGEGFDGGGGKPVDPATRVDMHFRWIRDFVAGSDKEPSPMEAAINKMGAMNQSFAQVSASANQGQAILKMAQGGGGGGGGGGGSAAGAAAQLKTLAGGLPKPVAAMLQTVSASGASVTSSGATQQLSDTWRTRVLPLCNAAFNRYPFVAGSTADVPVDDFTKLLGPAGLMDSFFNDNLAPLVDTSQTPWRWQSADHLALGLSPNTLTQFERAAQIRDALFSGGPGMAVKFELVPISLDPHLSRISLDIAGQAMKYDNGPTESVSFAWPNNGRTLMRVTMTPAGGGHETVIEKNGPWALLHLMDAARVVPSGQPDKFRLIFSSPTGQAVFELNASSVRNPFTMSALRSFRCPAKL